MHLLDCKTRLRHYDPASFEEYEEQWGEVLYCKNMLMKDLEHTDP